MDVSHLIGNDIAITSSVSATADMLNVVNPTEGQQRVLRRLLTNPGAYIWQPSYGAGLARFLGQPINNLTIGGTIRQQMKLEQAVKQLPPPNVTLASQKTGVVVAGVQYIDAETNLTSSLSIPLTDIATSGV